jgi:uncharacterized protein (DUF2237 family)
MKQAKNVYGTHLKPCCINPITGFFRDGLCRTHPQDHGEHTICIYATKTFLAFSKNVGNDLSTPMPEFGFSGVKEGDCWCLCALRWVEALEQNCAPPINLEATEETMLKYVSLEILEKHAMKFN